jgi:hypothetical protein
LIICNIILIKNVNALKKGKRGERGEEEKPAAFYINRRNVFAKSSKRFTQIVETFYANRFGGFSDESPPIISAG